VFVPWNRCRPLGPNGLVPTVERVDRFERPFAAASACDAPAPVADPVRRGVER
jgi:hypothetical protein